MAIPMAIYHSQNFDLDSNSKEWCAATTQDEDPKSKHAHHRVTSLLVKLSLLGN